MHFAHLFNFIKINNETPFVSVILFNALSAKNGKMIRTIEMLNSLVMLFTQQTIDTRFVFKVNVSEDKISFHYFI
jgi:hypothetical protein